MPQVAIVTDASVDLPPAVADGLGLVIAPLSYDVGGRHYFSTTQSNAEFYKELGAGAKTIVEGVTADDFEAAMRKGADQAGDVICVCQSVGSSFTRVSAEVAVRRLQSDGKRVELISPGRSTLGMGAICIAAAKKAADGASTDDVFKYLETLSTSADTYAIPANLDHLDRIGELSILSSQSSVGRIDEGAPVFRIRGRFSVAAATETHEEAEAELVKRAEQSTAGKPAIVVVSHAGADAAAQRLAEAAKGRINVAELHITEMGPTLGSVLGAGAYALGFCALPG